MEHIDIDLHDHQYIVSRYPIISLNIPDNLQPLRKMCRNFTSSDPLIVSKCLCRWLVLQERNV